MQEPSEEKINKWFKFIHCNITVFRGGERGEVLVATLSKDAFYKEISTNNIDKEADFLTDVESIKSINNSLDELAKVKNTNVIDNINWESVGFKEDFIEVAKKAYYKNAHKKMTLRKYLKWRLEVIDGEIKPTSVKKAVLAAFIGSLFAMYWIVACFSRPPELPRLLIRILMGILNLFAVAALVCSIVFNLPLYFLISAAIVYGLFIIANCIDNGLGFYRENVEYQSKFRDAYAYDTYNEFIAYLKQGQTKAPRSLNNKINNIQKIEQEVNKEEKSFQSDEK